ncbi:MAG: RNase P modulator RnpM [Lachnospiraceae bacterium]
MNAVRKQPLRQCIGCGEMKDKRELLRIIKTPQEEIILDTTGKKNGRGAYICPDCNCLNKVIKTKGLDRAFKMSISSEIYDALKEELEKYESK